MPNKKLTKQQTYVLFEHGTDKPFDSPWLKNDEKGFYYCVNCGSKLFSSDAKFQSSSGWPSFDSAVVNAIQWKQDNSQGMSRTEAVCKKCGGHLGHIFDDGPTKTGRRFCINGSVLDFKKG